MIKFIRAESGHGIGNTIRALINAIWLSEIHNTQLDYSEISELLTLNNSSFKDTNICKDANGGSWALRIPDVYKGNYLYDMNKKLFLTYDTKITETRGIDFQYFNILQEVRDIYIKMFKKIKFNDVITKEVAMFASSIDFQNTVGVHVRTWKGYTHRNLICFDEDLLFNTISSIKTENILIISDDTNLIQKAKKLFPNIITCTDIFNWKYNHYPECIQINNDKKTYTLNNKTFELNCYQAIFEMLVLSKCKSIIGSYQSTFTDCAWWLSECKPITILETDIVTLLNRRYKARYNSI